MQIQVTFEIGTNVDDAAINVNNRVKQVEARLPQEVRRQGVNVERGSSAFVPAADAAVELVGPGTAFVVAPGVDAPDAAR